MGNCGSSSSEGKPAEVNCPWRPDGQESGRHLTLNALPELYPELKRGRRQCACFMLAANIFWLALPHVGLRSLLLTRLTLVCVFSMPSTEADGDNPKVAWSRTRWATYGTTVSGAAGGGTVSNWPPTDRIGASFLHGWKRRALSPSA